MKFYEGKHIFSIYQSGGVTIEEYIVFKDGSIYLQKYINFVLDSEVCILKQKVNEN